MMNPIDYLKDKLESLKEDYDYIMEQTKRNNINLKEIEDEILNYEEAIQKLEGNNNE